MKPHIFKQGGRWKAVYKLGPNATEKEVRMAMRMYFENGKAQQEIGFFLERLNNGT